MSSTSLIASGASPRAPRPPRALRGRSGRPSFPPRRTALPRRAPSRRAGRSRRSRRARARRAPCAPRATRRGRRRRRSRPSGTVVELLDEDGAAALELGDDVVVVDDLPADVDRRSALGDASSTMSIARSTPAQNERGPARSSVRGPTASAHSARAPLTRRRLRSARGPAIAIRGSVRERPASSATTRTTASGRPAAPAASQADSMSTARAEPSWPRRSDGPRIRLVEASGPTWT